MPNTTREEFQELDQWRMFSGVLHRSRTEHDKEEDKVQQVSVERMYVAFRRAEIALGGEAEVDSTIFHHELAYQLSLIITEDTLAMMTTEGIVEVRRVDKKGHRRWGLSRSVIAA